MNKNIIYTIVYFLILLAPIGMCEMDGLYPTHPAQPPPYMFGLIWGSLYMMMTASFYYLLQAKNNKFKNFAILFSIINLIMNKYWVVLWCDKKPKDAFILFIFYLMVIILNMTLAYSVSPISGILLGPLLIWGIIAIQFNKWTVAQK